MKAMKQMKQRNTKAKKAKATMLTKPTTLAHRHSSPNTVFLTCLKRPSQAVALNRARSADVPRGVRLI